MSKKPKKLKTEDVEVRQLSEREKEQLVRKWVKMVTAFPEVEYKVKAGVPVNGVSQMTVLHCRELPDELERGCGISRNNGRSQWAPNVGRNRRLKKLTAYRAPYDLFGVMDDVDTVSHLCHNTVCFNPFHHALESLNTNKGRNWCPGPMSGCVHDPPCLRQGHQYKHATGALAGNYALALVIDDDSELKA